jgi:hypothetical protein
MEKDLVFRAIVTGPKEYLPEGTLIENFVISPYDVDEVREDGETEEDAIAYLKEEYIAEWEQRWCKVQLFTEEEYQQIKNQIP